MISKESLDKVWRELAEGRSVMVVCRGVGVAEFGTALFDFLRALKPKYESLDNEMGEMQMPNDTWVFVRRSHGELRGGSFDPSKVTVFHV